MKTDISGLPTGAVLAALYNETIPKGMGLLVSAVPRMTAEQGALTLGEAGAVRGGVYFDYLGGRCLKLHFEDRVDDGYASVDVRLYDREYGEGTAQRIIGHLTAASR